MGLMLSVPINFLLMKPLLVVNFFFFAPWQPASEMWKGFNPLSSLPHPRLSFSPPPTHTQIQKSLICAKSQGKELVLQVTSWVAPPSPRLERFALFQQVSYNIGQISVFVFL